MLKDVKINLKVLRNSINLNKETWNHIFSTNCYAYALGLDIPEAKIVKNAYKPGVISGCKYNLAYEYCYPFELLVQNLMKDLDALNIVAREVDVDEKIEKNEWKIAIFSSPFTMYLNGLIKGFHFMRENKKGIWYHKPGWLKKPTYYDDNKNVIISPSECNLKLYEFEKCYALRAKKQKNI